MDEVLICYINLKLQLDFDDVAVIRYTSGYMLDIVNMVYCFDGIIADTEKILFDRLKDGFPKLYRKNVYKTKLSSITSNGKDGIIAKFSYKENNINRTLGITYSCKHLIRILNSLYKNKKEMSKLFCHYMLLNVDSGHFFSAPPAYYSIFVGNNNEGSKNMNNAIECFSSVFDKTLKNYYSLFPKIEIGSSGNFFNEFEKDDKYNYYLINPPATEYITISVLTMVKKKKLNNQTILLYLPYWKDLTDPFIKFFKKIKYKVIKTPLVYDHIEEQYFRYKNFPIIFIVIGDNMDDVNDIYNKCIKELV